MRHLVFTNRHPARLIGQDVRTLEQGVTEESVRRQVAFTQIFLLVFITWELAPANRAE